MILKSFSLSKTLSSHGCFPKEDAHCGCLNLEKTEAARILRSGFFNPQGNIRSQIQMVIDGCRQCQRIICGQAVPANSESTGFFHHGRKSPNSPGSVRVLQGAKLSKRSVTLGKAEAKAKQTVKVVFFSFLLLFFALLFHFVLAFFW